MLINHMFIYVITILKEYNYFKLIGLDNSEHTVIFMAN